jgi:hypothetical protein
MKARILAAVAAALPLLAGIAAPPLVAARWLPGPASAVLVVLAAAVTLRRQLGAVVFAGLLLAVGGYTAAEGRAAWEGVRADSAAITVDLTRESFPEEAPRFVRVTGFLRAEWVLDEYQVPEGSHPDQNTAAPAVLVPLAGSRQQTVVQEGPVVVARVARGVQERAGLETIMGRTRPLDAGILEALVEVRGAPASATGVLVDTLDRPRTGDAWIRWVVALVCALVGGAVLAGAATRERV